MLVLNITKEVLVRALQLVMNAVEKKQTFPILSHVLFQQISDQQITLTTTDMEIELKTFLECDIQQSAGIGTGVTVPARKLFDICKALPDQTSIQINISATEVNISALRSRYHLATLAAEQFPSLDSLPAVLEFPVKQKELRTLLEKTHFAMAQQDVRYYLNGLMLAVGGNRCIATATNGHRLATTHIEFISQQNLPEHRFILPRKAVSELLHILSNEDEDIIFSYGGHHASMQTKNFTFTTKLIDGQIPDFNKVIPRRGEQSFTEQRDVLKELIARVSVLSSERFQGIEWFLHSAGSKVVAHNPEHEQAEEEFDFNYRGEPLQIAFNARYLQDVLNVLPEGEVDWWFSGDKQGVIIQSKNDPDSLYVVMPMRL